MNWHSQMRWRAQWARHFVRWLGYSLTAGLLTLLSGLFWLSSIPGTRKWWMLLFAAGGFVLLAAWAGWRSAPDELLRSVDREFAGRLGSCRQSPSREQGEDPSWHDAFVGMFCGPVLTALLSAAVYWVGAKLGYSPPSDRAFAFNLLLGGWLGLFTWVHLGSRFNAQETGRWLLGSGLTSLAVIAWVTVVHARQGGGTWSREHAWGTLFVLFVPLVWSVIQVGQGILAHLGGECPPGDSGPDGDGGPGPSDSDGGAGRPAPTCPAPPRRSSSYAEPRPEQARIH